MRALTKADKERGDKIRQMGCVVCELFNDVFTPTAIHHMDGQTKEGCHDLTIGLCDKHHQHKDNEKPQRWISRHGDGRAAFEKAYGPESQLLEYVNGYIQCELT